MLIVNVKFGGAVGVNKVSTTCNLLLSLWEREKIPKGGEKLDGVHLIDALPNWVAT